MSSLKAKFLIPACLLVLTGMGVLLTFNSLSTRSSFRAMFKDSMATIVHSIADSVTTDLEEKIGMLSFLCEGGVVAQAALSGQAGEAVPYLDRFLERTRGSGIAYLNVFDAKGDLVCTTVRGAAKFSIADRPYHSEIMGGKSFTITYTVSRTNQKPVVVLSLAVRTPEGQTVGVVNAGVEMEVLTKIANATKIGSTGYAAIMDSANGNMLAHPDPAKILKTDFASTGLGKQVMAVTGLQAVESPDGDDLLVAVKAAKTGWVFYVSAPMADMDSRLGDILRSNMIIISVVTVLLLGVIAFLVSRMVLKPLAECVNFAGHVAQGRFDQDIALSGKDEFGSLSASLRSMVHHLRQGMQELAEKRTEAEAEVAKTAQALDQAQEARAQADLARTAGMQHAAMRIEEAVGTITLASQEITYRSDDIAHGAQTQKDRLQNAAAAMEQMNASTLEVAQNASRVADDGAQAKQTARAGTDLLTQSVNTLNSAQQQSKNLGESMRELGEEARSIGGILNVISDIADQTNLLALNAAIEAARAGEAGRGFAVVADEVRKLAEKTMSATQEVGRSINSVQQATTQNIEAMEASMLNLDNATGLANRSAVMLEAIVAGVEDSSKGIQSIAIAAEQQSAASQEITKTVGDILGITLDTAATAHETSVSVRELAEQAQALSLLVEELKGERREIS